MFALQMGWRGKAAIKTGLNRDHAGVSETIWPTLPKKCCALRLRAIA
jgi:hypothetical protein